MKIIQPFKTYATALALGWAAFSPAVQAATADDFETITLPASTFNLNPGETRSIELGAFRHIRKLYIQAEGYRQDAMFEVVVNGDTKGSVYVPGRDPSYVVTVAETTQSVELRHVSGGTVQIHDVKALISTWQQRPTDPGRFPELGAGARARGTELARRAMWISDQFEYNVSPYNYTTYVYPIKRVAARVYVLAAGRGDMDLKTAKALQDLVAQIDFAKPFLDQTMKIDRLFELSVELLTLREYIDDLLN